MVRRRNGSRSRSDASSPRSYFLQLRNATAEFLPHDGLPLLTGDGRVRWTDRILTYVALFMAWGVGSLADRFTQARDVVAELYVSRRQPGETHVGFAKALMNRSAGILARLAIYWRQCVARVARRCWDVDGWVLFGFDGTKIDCPRTLANEQALGVSGKNNSGPQMLLTCLFHMGSGILWGWKRSGIRGHSEREHLMQLLPLLPGAAMLVADAGLTGYDLLKALLVQGNDFLIRVGANVHLPTNLGYHVSECKDTVYLWPLDKQGRRSSKRMPRSLKRVHTPLALRLIRRVDAKGRPVCLLTNVFDRRRLSPSVAARIYRMRWGVEVMWRSLKQTMGHRKMLSGSPQRAESELDWAVAGLWMVQMMSVKKMPQSRRLPHQYSPASSLRALRIALNGGPKKRRRKRWTLAGALAAAVKDGYHRHSNKNARHYPHKRPQRPPGEPVARKASQLEKRLLKRILEQPPPKSAAA